MGVKERQNIVMRERERKREEREIKGKPYHLGNATVGEDVAGMDKPVEHLSCLLDQVTLVRVIFKLLICDRGKERNNVSIRLIWGYCRLNNSLQGVSVIEQHTTNVRSSKIQNFNMKHTQGETIHVKQHKVNGQTIGLVSSENTHRVKVIQYASNCTYLAPGPKSYQEPAYNVEPVH